MKFPFSASFFAQEMLQSSPAALPPASNPPPGIVVPAAALPPGNLAMSTGSGSPAVPGREPWGGSRGRWVDRNFGGGFILVFIS